MRLFTVLFIPFLFTYAGNSSAADSESREKAIQAAITHVKPSLVRIHVVSVDYRDGRELKYQSSGSGAIISADGYVITNHHVAGHGTRLLCTLSNREEIEAELIGTDPMTDIAVIKLLPSDKRTFPVAVFGDSDKVEVGDLVFAMGSPMSLSQSITQGIVSNNEMILPRRMGFGGFKLDGEDVGGLVRWFAHDAVIYGGNSGGPLVNDRGEIIGINEISIGLGGAIPGNLAKQIALDIIDDGRVSRSWLGLNIQPLLKHGDHDTGVLVTSVIDGSPASNAGIESGDILLSISGNPFTVRFDEDIPMFNIFVANMTIGEAAEAIVLRGSTTKSLQITPVQRENYLSRQTELKQWGITARNISYVMAKELKRDTRDGVLITSVRPGGPAGDAKPALSRGDILMKAGKYDIKNLDDLHKATTEITKGSDTPQTTLTSFERRNGSFITVVDVGIKELNDPGLEVKKAWLPVKTQVITRNIAEAMNDTSIKGFRITEVYKDSSADKAGLQTGDLITALDGEPLTASAPEDYEELPTLIRAYRAGSMVELSVIRDEQKQVIEVELIRAPKLNREMPKYQDNNFEYTARDITFFDDARGKWGGQESGVLISEVKSGGWASLGMLQSGDLLQEVDNIPVSSVDDLKEIMNTISDDQPDSVVLKVLRGIYTVYVELEPKWINP